MRIIHLSDLHLGHRAFPRTERGVNLRERDVHASFQLAVHEIMRIRPDLVLLSGDLFDHPDPPSAAFLTLTRGLRLLQEHLPGVPILAIAGERDTPNAPADPGPVAVLDSIPGVEAAAGAPRSVHLAGLDAHVLLVPYRAVIRPPFPELRPDPSARWNILLLRGRPVLEANALDHPEPPQGSGMGPLELRSEGWDYIALGGAHEARIHAPRIRTSGSLERVGGDPWKGVGSEKGFYVVDLATGEGEFHPLPTRPVVDLAPVRVDPNDLEAGTRRLRDLLEGTPGGMDGKILRVRLRGPIRTPAEGIQPGLLSAIRQRTAHVEFLVEPVEGTEGGRRIRPPKEPPSSESPTQPSLLQWRLGNGRSGETVLTPGVWAISAEHPEDRERIRETLESEGPVEWEARGIRFEIKGTVARFPASRLSTLASGGEGEDAQASPPPHRDREPLRAGSTTARSDSASTGLARIDSVPTGSAPTEPREPLNRLRADWIEAAGEAEVRTLDWARERQDADSRLLMYRDRARELRERIRTLETEGPDATCPTCKRPLSEAHPDLLAQLREEWEDVVQDGRWWRRRREQLEDKPSDLTTLERRAMELQAALQVAQVSENRHGSAKTEVADGSRARGAFARPPAPTLVTRAGFLLQQLTEGRVEGLILDEGGLFRVMEPQGGTRFPDLAEAALIPLLVALAVDAEDATDASDARGPQGTASGGVGAEPSIRLLTGLHSIVPNPVLTRLLDQLSSQAHPQDSRAPHRIWIVLLPPEVVTQRTERVQGHLEVLRDESGRPRVRVTSVGSARVRISHCSAGENQ